jgi:hypothetical protein
MLAIAQLNQTQGKSVGKAVAVEFEIESDCRKMPQTLDTTF